MAGGAAIAAPPLAIAGRAVTTSHAEVIARTLKTLLPGMQIPHETLVEFGSEFVRRAQPYYGKRFDVALLIMDNSWMENFLPEKWRFKYDSLLRRMMTDFLFSTDLFTSANGNISDATYVAFADALELGCRNPLARFDFD